MHVARPTIQELIRAIDEVDIGIYERVTVSGLKNGKWVRKSVSGAYDPDQDRIRIGRRHHRRWGGADELITTVIHEALHRARPKWSERAVRQHELQYFRSRALRERAAVRLLNIVVFGNNWEEAPPEDSTDDG